LLFLPDVFEKAQTMFGPVEILINTAGICLETEWHDTMEVNFVSIYCHVILISYMYYLKVCYLKRANLIPINECHYPCALNRFSNHTLLLLAIHVHVVESCNNNAFYMHTYCTFLGI
jgi:hypothetical protein